MSAARIRESGLEHGFSARVGQEGRVFQNSQATGRKCGACMEFLLAAACEKGRKKR